MSDIGPWRPADDEMVRAALESLIDDVDRRPMPDPAEIRAAAPTSRGRGPRRHLVLLAAAAAAVIGIGSGAAWLAGRPGDAPLPPASSSSSTPSTPAPTSPTSSSTSSTSATTTTTKPLEDLYLPPSAWEVPGGLKGLVVSDEDADPRWPAALCSTIDPGAARSGYRQVRSADGALIGYQRIEAYSSAAEADARYTELSDALAAGRCPTTDAPTTSTSLDGGVYEVTSGSQGGGEPGFANTIGLARLRSDAVSVLFGTGEGLPSGAGIPADLARVNELASQR